MSKLHKALTFVTTLPSSFFGGLHETAQSGIIWTISTVMRRTLANDTDPEATTWAHTGITIDVARWDEDRTSRPRAVCSIDRRELDRFLFKEFDEILGKEDIGGC